MKYRKQIDTIFLDLNSNKFSNKGNVNVVLSPSLYWVKKVSLPVKYLRDVKPLLPSLFEDILPVGVYSYSAYKKEDDFFIFAYEDKKILNLLNNNGISASHVNNVYFAQNEFGDMQEAIKIDKDNSLYFKDEQLVIVPNIWVEDSSDLDISSIKLSKEYIKLKQFGHIVNDKIIYSIMALLIFFILIIGIEYFITTKKISDSVVMREELFEKYKLKPTMLQNRSMLKGYKATHVKQKKLRKYISFILSLSLRNSIKVSLINIKSNTLIVEFKGVSRGGESSLENAFESKNIKYVSSFKNKFWHLEIKL